nr:immunoglobulin heavy chain junction region [Mus musculus]MBK4188775.1 immunoglobulin heavy chain junction region [Mus musculus]MBK4198644.1 immunoglobulin heavy chain junction region [Mus musculus]MBK4198645.1 immunoglobulin heavy chain junction region [Mus musculus]MBK4198646.1 immunoglobulin heavy chain junction region [Mus musculus]
CARSRYYGSSPWFAYW